MSWFAGRGAGEPFLTAITEAKLRTGVAIPSMGQRRDRLVAAIDAVMDQDFAGCALPFDSNAARSHAAIAAERRAAERPIIQADCQVAAIARFHEADVATRNVGDFEGCGIDVSNPWVTE